ncbi:hypothetical protein SANTM175S_10433 [Streptomyces antimycoticus]
MGADLGVEVLEAVEAAVVSERLLIRPRPLQDLQILIRAGVTVVLAQIVAVPPLLGVAPAADDVHGHPSAGELVEGGERTGGQGGGHEAGPMGHQQPEPLGARGDIAATWAPSGVAEP